MGYYEKLSKQKKISVHRSIDASIESFMQKYKWDLSNFTDENMVIYNIHFYWFKRMCDKTYIWCDGMVEELFDEEFVEKIRDIIKFKYLKIEKNISRKPIKNQRKVANQ